MIIYFIYLRYDVEVDSSSGTLVVTVTDTVLDRNDDGLNDGVTVMRYATSTVV